MKLIHCILLISCLCACSESEVAPYAPGDMDLTLLGCWYSVEKPEFLSNGPEICFLGFEITASKQYFPLGIETRTGKVARTGECYKIIECSNGSLRFSIHWISERRLYTTANGRLIIRRADDWSMVMEFQRTYPGAQITRPHLVEWTATTDHGDFSLPPVAPYLPAYAVEDSGGILTVKAWPVCTFGDPFMRISISNFHGEDFYPINSGDVSARLIAGDIIYFYSSIPGGMINIDRYDTLSNRCTGTFDLIDLADEFHFPCPWNMKNGRFSVPIFR